MVPALVLRLQRYLSESVPLAGDLVPHPERKQLPLAFQESHAPYLGTIGSHTVTFVLADVGEPAAAGRAVTTVGKILRTQDVVLVAESLTAAQRRGLIVAGTPFVVPDAHLWLPMLGLQFTERGPKILRQSAMRPATQALLLHWYHHGLADSATLVTAAAALGYTTMTMSRAFDELARYPHPQLHIVRDGRERRCTTTLSRPDLWQHYGERARTPVVRVVLTARTPEMLSLPLAGLSAVAALSNLATPSIEVRAMDLVAWRRRQKSVELVAPYTLSDKMVVHLEIWAYTVRLHDPEAPLVEPISLALSIPQSEREDPRVSQALRQMEHRP